MKRTAIALAIILGLTHINESYANGSGKTVEKQVLMTYEEELELLKDYIPDLDTSFLNELISIQVYDSNYELLMEGTSGEFDEIGNIELHNLVAESDYVTRIDNQVIYIHSK